MKHRATGPPRRPAATVIVTSAILLLGVTATVLAERAQTQSAAPQSLPFQNPDLPIAARVDDLLSHMTLEEKANEMVTNSHAIPRLGIPAYYWWSESLHGNAFAGTATVFPQAIGLASTWDPDLHFQVATATSDENCAKYYETVREGRPQPFHGLTFFAPNINIFRDPRWGRGQETYGEDPYLTGRFAVAFVKGLQGDDPVYLKNVATPKHYAVHSGPEPERHVFDANVSKYDLADTYLPAFRAAIVEGHAESIMGAYSSLYGIPDCANPLLLQDYLRTQWSFDGYVVSDCGAINDIYVNHHYASSREDAAAKAVKAGCDLACEDTYTVLPAAVQQGLITEPEINTSLRRLLTMRFRLGMFDPPSRDRYAQIPMSVVDSDEHRQLARRVAEESIVLLKNDAHALPLAASVHSIAVIGPNADSVPALVGNYNGTPSHPVTIRAGIEQRAAAAGVHVEYVQGVPLTIGSLGNPLPVPATALLGPDGQPGLQAEFFNNDSLSGTAAATRRDNFIAFRFGADPPEPGVNASGFSVRWTGQIVPPQTGDYTLSVRGDHGCRLYVGDQKVLDNWDSPGAQRSQVQVSLVVGQPVSVRLEYAHTAGNGGLLLAWKVPPPKVDTAFPDAIAAANRADAIVYVCGLTAQLEGEEGTNGGGDRTDLNLPGYQEQLLEALQKTGKPVILVLLNGSALGVTWAAEHVPAIVEAWYPGEEGGDAVAGALFGDFSPAGRLPITVYRSVDQIPPFRDYAMKGRTYRYFTGDPLYRFGDGQSYTTFRYRDLSVSAGVTAGQPVTVTASVQNTGDRESDEVAELYLRPAPDRPESDRRITADQPMPRIVLAGFLRLHLKPGESAPVTFTLTPEQLLLVSEAGKRDLQPGVWQVYVGGHQPDVRRTQRDVVTARLTVK